MTSPRLLPALALLACAGFLSACATTVTPDLSAEVPYCHRTTHGRVVACTRAPAPSLSADAQAKKFAPDSKALVLYVVRRNWADGSQLIKVQADTGPTVETLPETMVRMKLQPGSHSIAFEVDGQRQTAHVQGKAGDVRFVRIEGKVWAWSASYVWTSESEAAIRDRALKTRLVADLEVP